MYLIYNLIIFVFNNVHTFIYIRPPPHRAPRRRGAAPARRAAEAELKLHNFAQHNLNICSTSASTLLHTKLQYISSLQN